LKKQSAADSMMSVRPSIDLRKLSPTVEGRGRRTAAPGSAGQWGTVTVVLAGMRFPAGSAHSTEIV